MARPLVALGLALVLPWTTWARLGAPTRAHALVETPLLLFSLGAVLLIALQVGRRDPWLGAFVALAALTVLRRPHAFALETALWIASGAIVLDALRRIPAAWHPFITAALVTVAMLQAAIVGLQAQYLDPLATGSLGRTVLWWPAGTLGNPTWIAAFLALIVPLAAPLPALVLLGGIACTQSLVGAAAALVGLLVARRWRLASAGLLGAATVAVARGVGHFGDPIVLTSATTRWEVQRLGLVDWWTNAALFGHGPGAWIERVPARQVAANVYTSELFLQAHNDLLQLVYEFGVPALVCLVSWCWWHRAAFRSAYAGALMALAVVSVAMFPWHLAILAVLGLLVIALATPPAVPPRSTLAIPAPVLRLRVA